MRVWQAVFRTCLCSAGRFTEISKFLCRVLLSVNQDFVMEKQPSRKYVAALTWGFTDAWLSDALQQYRQTYCHMKAVLILI